MKVLKTSFSYIKESRNYIWIGVALFTMFLFIGFFFPMFEEQIAKIILELQAKFEGLNLWQTIIAIFFNNAKASLVAISFGIFFGVVPLIIALTNGYLVGFITRIVSEEYSFFELWRLLPHGVFELPAVLISIGMGLRIGIEILTKPSKKNLWTNLKNASKTFLLIIIPLLIIAAIIEGFLIFFA